MTFNEFLSNYGLFIALTIFSVIIVLVLFFLFIPRLKKEEKVEEHSVNKEHFISLLGGNENILEVTLRGSRLTVSLKDPSLANVEELKKHGVDRVIVMQSKLVLLVNNEVASLFDNLP